MSSTPTHSPRLEWRRVNIYTGHLLIVHEREGTQGERYVHSEFTGIRVDRQKKDFALDDTFVVVDDSLSVAEFDTRAEAERFAEAHYALTKA